jgi:hypothetical protein
VDYEIILNMKFSKVRTTALNGSSRRTYLVRAYTARARATLIYTLVIQRRNKTKCIIPGFLSTRQTDTPGANFCSITILKHIQVCSQSASIDDLFVPLLIERRTEEYIVLDGKMLEPWGLSSIGETMHKTVSVNFVGIFGEYELSLELGRLSEKRHLSWKVNEP